MDQTPHTADSPLVQRLALGALVMVAFLWSLNGPLIKLLTLAGEGQRPVDGFTIACWRSLIGGLPLFPLLVRHRRQMGQASKGWLLTSGLSFAVMALSFAVATTKTAAANAIALQYTSSIWVFALSPWLLNERPKPGDRGVLLVAVTGVAIIFFGNGVAATPWLLVALLAGLSYGMVTLSLRGLRGVSPMALTAMNACFSGLVLLIPALIWGRLDLSATQWLIVASLGLLQFTLPYILFAWALQHVPAHHAALILYAEVGMNPLWTWLVVGEPPPLATCIGGPIILASVIWHLGRNMRAAKRYNPTIAAEAS